jgi:limonene-1,2-epoxide hydrolase
MTKQDEVSEQKKSPAPAILDAETIKELWSKTYNTEGKPDWSHILPYYDDNIYFRDSIQQIEGIDEFKAMTERLANRSKDLKMNIVRAIKENNIVFIEWEMTIRYKKNPSSVLYGSSRLTLTEEGKIGEQRDYYDLWGDIFDNIPRFGKAYRRFMRRKFG